MSSPRSEASGTATSPGEANEKEQFADHRLGPRSQGPGNDAFGC